jgi:hydroxymethylbilane synthase
MAVHSLKDLPTELPSGLKLGGVGGRRQDARDVLIYRDAAFLQSKSGETIGRSLQPATSAQTDWRGFRKIAALAELPASITIATSSTRRAAQLLGVRPDFKIVPMRGNVATRLNKLFTQPELDATVLAAAGLARLNIWILPTGQLQGEGIPDGLLATFLEPEEVLPCVGQAAIGLEIRDNDALLQSLCDRLSDPDTLNAVLAERSLLRAMGGGCQTPLGAYAEVFDGQLHMRAVSYIGGQLKRAQGRAPVANATQLGEDLARQLK